MSVSIPRMRLVTALSHLGVTNEKEYIDSSRGNARLITMELSRGAMDEVSLDPARPLLLSVPAYRLACQFSRGHEP